MFAKLQEEMHLGDRPMLEHDRSNAKRLELSMQDKRGPSTVSLYGRVFKILLRVSNHGPACGPCCVQNLLELFLVSPGEVFLVVERHGFFLVVERTSYGA